MAAPVVQSTSSLAGSFTSTAVIPIPSGVVAGDVIIVSAYDEGSGAITPPAGFTLKQTVTCTGSHLHSQNIYWKRASGAEGPGNYTFTFGGAVWNEGWAARISGCVASGDPFGAPVNTATTNSTGGPYTVTPAVATLTPSANDCLVLFSGTIWNGGGNTWTPPSGFTEQIDSETGTLATLSQTTATATGSVTATATNNSPGLTGLVAYLLPGVATAAVTARASAGFAAAGTSRKAATVTARAPAGAAATGLARKVGVTTGRATAGVRAQAVARKVTTTVARSSTGVAGTGVSRKLSTATGRAAVGLGSRGGSSKTTPATGRASVGLAAAGTGRKVAGVTGVASVPIAAAGSLTAIILRAVAARVATGIGGQGLVVKRATATGAAAVGATARGAALKRSPAAGSAGVGLSARAGARKVSSAAASAAVGLTAAAGPGKRVAIAARSVLGIAAVGAGRRVIGVTARAAVGFRASSQAVVELLRPGSVTGEIGPGANMTGSTTDGGSSLIGSIE